MSRSRVRARGARASELWWLISWDRGGKGGGMGMAGVKAAMGGSGKKCPFDGPYGLSIHVCYGSHGGEVGRVSCGGDSMIAGVGVVCVGGGGRRGAKAEALAY